MSSYNAFGYLDLYCTATLIGSNWVAISAAHCFYEDGDWRSDLDGFGYSLFRPGYDFANPSPFGAHLVHWYWMPGQWIDDGTYYRDWALLALATRPNVEGWGAAALGSTATLSAKLHMVAYPSAKHSGRNMWHTDCSAISVFSLSIRHDCQSWNGSSGGAVYRYHSGDPQILAINKGNPWQPENENYNVGVRLRSDRIERINDFIEEFA